jgi:hypothetical protein
MQMRNLARSKSELWTVQRHSDTPVARAGTCTSFILVWRRAASADPQAVTFSQGLPSCIVGGLCEFS